MSQIALVNPNVMKPAVAPLALEYLAESLAAAGHGIEILDLAFSTDLQADIRSFFASNSPDFVGFTIRNTDDCYFASRDFFIPKHEEIIGFIKSNTDAPVVLGGAGLSVAPAAVLEMTAADYAIAGDGEEAFSLFASGASPSVVPGMTYRTESGIRSNPAASLDVSKLPIRSRKFLDNARYFKEGGQAGVETKRGCNGACIYCADPAGKGRTCRLRPTSHILAEIRSLVEQGIDCIHLCDSEFNIPLSHAEDFCRAVIASDLNGRFTWYAYASPAPFTEGAADLMQRAGCVGIDFGADSGDDDILRSLGRDFTADDVRRTAKICRDRGIIFMYDLLIGGPAETNETAKRTIEMMKEIGPDRVGVSVGMRIFNGTAMAKMVQKEGFTPKNPALYGEIENNKDFLVPVYYLSPAVGMEVFPYLTELIGGDTRFLHASPEEIEGNYNYNDNSVLVQAIKSGHRGAYWDILRRLEAS